jgi:sugar phosphate permease
MAGVAAVFFGLAQSVTTAIVARVFVGMGVALLFVPTLKILTNWFTVAEFSRMPGVLMAVGGAGVLSAAGPLAYLSAAMGWPGSFMIMGGLTGVVAVAIWFLVRNTPQELGLPPVQDSAARAAGAQEKIALLEGMRLVLTNRSFWALALWYFFTCGVFFSFAALWGGHYLRQVHGLSQTEAGNVLNMLAVAMIVGSPLLGYFSDRVLKSRKKVILLTSLGLLGLTAWLAFWPQAMNLPLLYLWCFLLSLCSSAIVVVGFTSAKELFPVSIAGTSVGLVNLFPFLGGAVMQWAVGLVLDYMGSTSGRYSAEAFGGAFLLYFGCALAALLCALRLKETLAPSGPGADPA